MKKVLLSGFVIVTFIAYVIHNQSEGSDEVRIVAPLSVGEATTPASSPPAEMPTESVPPTSTPGSSSPPASSTPASPTPSQTGQYKDGQYTGDVTDAFYGNVQVKAVIQGGKIVDVKFLDYPQDRRTSIEINTQAMPLLTSEAIQAQSAQVDIVTGATQTSRAFRDSLQSALQKAH